MSEVFLCKWLNTRWQNSRWLPSSGWVRMNDFESDWIRLSQSFVQHGWIQDGRIQDGCHHLVSQIELVWVRVRVEEECFQWIWEKITRCLNLRWQCLNPTWQNSRWLPSSCWVRMNEWSSFCAKWLNPRWQSSRWLPSSSWVRMNEFESDWTSLSQSFVQNGWIQNGRIEDGCHHQVESEWMSEVLFVQRSESNTAGFKMAAIIKLSQNEWVKFFCTKWLNQGWEISR